MFVYLFPGQGSQARGMGDTLFDEFPEICNKANSILGYCIKTLCLQDHDQKLNQTQFTQPALYIVNALNYYKKIQISATKFDYAAGHSLGEYNALLAANVFDFETGLKLVKKRGELMQAAQSGSMAAIIGLTADEILHLFENHNLNNLTLANYNSYQQIVISGNSEEIKIFGEKLKKQKGVSFIPLRVNGAFHSPFMQEAEQEFAKYLDTFSFSVPTIPVIANYNASLYHSAAIKENLSKHISHPVLWTKSIEYLLTFNLFSFEEVGPGNVISGLIKRIKNGI